MKLQSVARDGACFGSIPRICVGSRSAAEELRRLGGSREEVVCRLPDRSVEDLDGCQKWLNESIDEGWMVGVTLQSDRPALGNFVSCQAAHVLAIISADRAVSLPRCSQVTEDGLVAIAEIGEFGEYDTSMRIRRLAALFALLVALILPSTSATADESGSGVGSVLQGTTISGYVGSSANWQRQQTTEIPRYESRGWWHRLLHRFGFCRRR